MMPAENDRTSTKGDTMYLDSFPLLLAQVGYGELGIRGRLGYEHKLVSVQRQTYRHALSTHPPARVLFHLNGRFAGFRAQVALNDDTPRGISHADFMVRVDGRQVASAPAVVAGESPRTITADITGAQLLELAVATSRWEHCHAVWLDPQVDEAPVDPSPDTLLDCLGRAEITLPTTLPRTERCIAMVVSPGFTALLDDLLGSLYANGGCQDALLLVFALGLDAECARVISKYRATLIPCQPRAPINPMSKAVLYSIARVVDARHYLCLDADMLVLGDLRPVFSALDACPETSILACREGNGMGFKALEHALMLVYGGSEVDRRQLFASDAEAAYSLVVNDGLFAGSRTALLALDATIRGMPQAATWIDQRRDIWWRNQFVFNLALARLRCGVELDGMYNVQLHAQDVRIHRAGARIEAEWRGRPVRVLHFSGLGRRKYPEWQGHFARVPDPLVGAWHGDAYSAFLAALRAWVGRYGLTALAWSFYGTTDAHTAQVSDPATLPLLAVLHYLIRANGCARVLESGTARGVSAACIASALAHRPEGRVVTMDPYSHAERAGLWAALPEAISACIEPRAVGSLEGMASAIAANERYDAALLDSIHTAEHVWAEFDLARQLVCPGGLILIHDVRYAHGTVEEALQRIEAAGYGVVRLWTAEGGACEDDRLGLAVIENRCRLVG
jgi:predicted O-methyltransferase YrrM